MIDSRRARRHFLAPFALGWAGLLGALPCCLSQGREPPVPGDVPVDQVTLGAVLFAEDCADCHGAKGQGIDESGVPALVGADALPINPRESNKLRRSQLQTAADVFYFTHEPPAAEPRRSGKADEWCLRWRSGHLAHVCRVGERVNCLARPGEGFIGRASP